MPELPEVETIARGLQRQVAGEVIESVWIGSKPEPLKSPARLIARTLEGARIAQVRRAGKHIVFDLEAKGAAAQWIVHLGMTGRMLVAQNQDEIAKHTHAIATLGSGRELRFVDPRRFGRLEVRTAQKFEAPGQEPLKVTLETFAQLFHGRKMPIKSALLNQKLLAGIGNIYADESLFRAGIRPRRLADRVTRAELHRLYDAVQQVLSEAIAAGGSSISDYVNAEGAEGLFQVQHRVYRREGEPCLVCGSKIRRTVIAGRSSHWCAKCQK
ncbi:MAG TPA: bifunctional DNA-formamidopyrimidine glycosylase/DNA-(apurinic or apyrimidinic site) lyase [Terriglobales bacterium]|nr:bifunctional DNA-formamidopyrimidine glycosylase/DNA-(apurinic or apyrimidinic site) lyase [Terriglobales bacterium]